MSEHRLALRLSAGIAFLLGATGCATPPPTPAQRIQHLVVIYAENHSFDNLYGLFPGADGIANASAEQKTVEVVEAVVLGVDHDQVLDALGGRRRRRGAASGAEQKRCASRQRQGKSMVGHGSGSFWDD